MIAFLGGVLAASLLGSAHCAAMCGGFVCFYANGGDRPGAGLAAHAAYHAGRLLSYATLGAFAGALGAGVTEAAALAGIARGAAVLAGALMVLWGGAKLLGALGLRLPVAVGAGARMPGAPSVVARALRAVAGRPPRERAFTLGLLTTLLPCGWLFAFVATAAGTGAPGTGALVLVAFWLGTVPALAAVGATARLALGPLGRRLPAIGAAAVLALGLLTLAGRTQALVPGSAAADAAAANEATHACH